MSLEGKRGNRGVEEGPRSEGLGCKVLRRWDVESCERASRLTRHTGRMLGCCTVATMGKRVDGNEYVTRRASATLSAAHFFQLNSLLPPNVPPIPPPSFVSPFITLFTSPPPCRLEHRVDPLLCRVRPSSRQLLQCSGPSGPHLPVCRVHVQLRHAGQQPGDREAAQAETGERGRRGSE